MHLLVTYDACALGFWIMSSHRLAREVECHPLRRNDNCDNFYLNMVLFVICTTKRLWFSGRTPRCGRGDPGSIPGGRTLLISLINKQRGFFFNSDCSFNPSEIFIALRI